ncbi:MAG: hypothetical protein A2Z38_05460 [Planctomycetes bacterium RBG_19FT_COMBO_48_8]|nr:MAG: hypothetical protein A2Z38_05460 [Planctomycetes bacterium RBG_19FT_COMBO_48_8]
MIKTLRITSVVAAILAGVFFVFPVVYGVRSDERIDEFLKLPSLREKFEDAADNQAKAGESRVSPLVEQAEAFALYLNPLKTTVQKASKGDKTTDIVSRLPVTPKFKVFGTIYFAGNPELSQALIDEPGRGRHWVRQSSMVGHLLVEQVKDGLVVVKSSKETFELLVEEKPDTASLNRISPASSLRSSQSPLESTSPASGRTAAGVRRTINMPQKLQGNGDDDEKMEELVDKLKDLQRNPASDNTDSELEKEKRSARIEQLISKFKSTRVSAEEAKKLDNIGEKLKGIQKDTNPSPPEADEGEVEVSPPQPDTSAEE